MARTFLILLIACAPAAAQEATLDVLDGETLYENGWLFTFGHEWERLEGRGVDRTLFRQTTALAAHYGLRYDVQLSAILPYVDTLVEGAGLPDEEKSGAGDFAFIGKWRIQRWDAPGVGTNLALIGGLEIPAGSQSEGALDPSLGVAITHEPGRWRFNAAMLCSHSGAGDDGFRPGDGIFFELAAGNRFWLEPYPGPFMRLDVMVRYRHEDRDRLAGADIPASGRDLWTAGATLAFRPRPTLDFQLFVEAPLHENVRDGGFEEGISVLFVMGYRI